VGIRGFGPMFTHGAGALGAAYAATANARTRVLVQIESRAGVEAVDEIASVDGLDALFIGCALSAWSGRVGADAGTQAVRPRDVARR
jgi:2-keto-3-deoxy-L-rhamnonate aldolase RhmA